MVSGETFTAIDIGSSKIKAIIGVFDNDKKLKILGVGVSPSNGIRKGNILDMDEFRANVDTALSEAEKMTGEQITKVYLTISGTGIEVESSNGIIAIPEQEVSEDDVNRALDMAKNGVNLVNRVVLKVIPETFSCDLEHGIKNPVGMFAKKLEVRTQIFSVGANILNNIKKGIFDVGVDIADIYPILISSPEAVLTKRQKELGVVCVDIGASTTGISVYEEGSLIFSSVVPIGGENVTSDIALGARVSIDLAEKLKVEFGDLGLCKEEKAKDEDIDMSKLSKNETEILSKKYLSEIVRARYQEIFYFINNELKRVGKDGMLPEGAVLTGGGAKMKGILDLSKEILRLPSSIGVPEDSDYISGTSIGDPIFSSVIGALTLSQKYGSSKTSFKLSFSIGGFWNSLKNLFNKIIP